MRVERHFEKEKEIRHTRSRACIKNNVGRRIEVECVCVRERVSYEWYEEAEDGVRGGGRERKKRLANVMDDRRGAARIFHVLAVVG